MKLSLFGRVAMALVASLALGLGMTACGGGTIAYLWVLGTQSGASGTQLGQIAGFKVDNYTGNLTTAPKSPFPINGSNPVSILVRPGGRYVYVISQGTGTGLTTTNGVTSFAKTASSGISVYAVGGDGTLTFEVSYQSQGFIPMWAQFDGSGNYIYVLDKFSPGASPTACASGASTSGCFGSITAFSIDPATGRLTLVGNTQTQVGGLNTYYFNVGSNPLMMKSTGSCMYTVNSADHSLTAYGLNGTNGQLTVSTNQTIPTSTTNITSINGNGSYIFLTDSGSNRIFPYSVGGSNCALTILTGGSVANSAGATTPVYSLLDNAGTHLYVLNQGTTAPTTTPNSSITAYTLNSTSGTLSEILGSPYTTGSGPVCLVEDSSNQYIYISNKNDGTVTGKVIDSTTGKLSDLSRGATFQSLTQAGCLAISNNVN